MGTVAVEEDLSPATWRDGKRYAWLLGPARPAAAVHRLGPGRGDRPRRLLVLRPVPRLRDLPAARHGRSARTPRTRPTASSSGSRRTATTAGAPTLFIPLQYASLVVACWLWSTATSRPSRASASRCTMAMVAAIAINTAHELGHKRASLERWLSQGRARADRLRPLLHRAQPRPPRARRDAGGPGQLAARRELLGVPAAHAWPAACAPRWELEAERLRPRRAAAAGRSSNDILNAWAMTRRAVRRAGRRVRRRVVLP